MTILSFHHFPNFVKSFFLASFCTLLHFNILLAQSNCPAEITPEDFSALAPDDQPLCTQFGHFVPDEGFEFSGNTQTSSLPNNSIINKKIYISGTFNIDDDFIFENCVIKFAPGAVVIVHGLQKLTVKSSKLFSCEKMWHGIVVATTGGIHFENNRIEDAYTAIDVALSCIFKVDYNTFNRNYIGVNVNGTNFTGGDCIFNLTNDIFKCNAPLLDNYFIQPYLGPISQTGVKLTNVLQINITNCTFLRQRYGIESVSSDAVIKGSTFTHMLNPNLFIASFDPGIGILAKKNSNITVIGLGSDETSGYTFYNCVNACVIGSQSNCIVTNCRSFITGNSGMDFSLTSNKYTQVYANRFEGGVKDITSYALFMQHSSTLNDIIRNNHFELNDYISGIACFGTTPNTGGYLEIRDNVLNLGYNAIGMDLHRHTNMGLYNNNVNTPDTYFNIHLFDSDGGSAENMNVQVGDNIFDAGTNGTNFHLEESKRIQFCSNHFYNGTLGLSVEGMCNQSELYNNEFMGSDIGLNYKSDTETEVQSHRGNYWVGSFPSWGAFHEGSNFLNSTFEVNPNLPAPVVTGTFTPSVNPQTWFKHENQPLNPCLFGVGGEMAENADFKTAVASGSYQNTALSGLSVWNAERELYHQLHTQPELLAGNDLYNSFYELHATDNIGLLEDIEFALGKSVNPDPALSQSLSILYAEANTLNKDLFNLSASLTSDPDNPTISATIASKTQDLYNKKLEIQNNLSLQEQQKQVWLSSAQSLIQNLVPLEIYEENAKSVNEILWYKLSNPESLLTTQQLEMLRTIAAQCPTEGGTAVGTAITLLPKCEQIYYHKTAEECAGQRSALTETENGFKVALMPSPASDWVNISISDSLADEEYWINVFDLNGQLILSRDLSSSKSIKLSTTSLKSGFYLYKVQGRSGHTVSGKLLIAH